MTRKEIIEKIVEVEKDAWGKGSGDRRWIKEEFLDELEDMANEEGCEWGEQTPQIVELYRRLQPDYCSKKFADALFEEIINLYAHMIEWTEVEELPEREEVVKVKKPAVRRRVWNQ